MIVYLKHVHHKLLFLLSWLSNFFPACYFKRKLRVRNRRIINQANAEGHAAAALPDNNEHDANEDNDNVGKPDNAVVAGDDKYCVM